MELISSEEACILLSQKKIVECAKESADMFVSIKHNGEECELYFAVSTDLKKDIATVMNRHGIDTKTNTPDFILADFLFGQINLLMALNRENLKWHSGEVLKGISTSELTPNK